MRVLFSVFHCLRVELCNFKISLYVHVCSSCALQILVMEKGDCFICVLLFFVCTLDTVDNMFLMFQIPKQYTVDSLCTGSFGITRKVSVTYYISRLHLDLFLNNWILGEKNP